MLPEPFSDLERYVPTWDKPGTNARYAIRLASSMNDMKVFYRDIIARLAEIKKYLDAKPFAQYNDGDKSLARLVFAACIAGQAVEVYRQPTVPDSGATDLRIYEEPEIN